MKKKIVGVSYYPRTKKWIASITIKGERIHLGYHDTKLQAADARALYEQDHPREPKVRKTKAKSAEPSVAPARRAVEKPAQSDPFALRYDRSKPLGPDNYDLIICYPQVWGQIVRDGWDQVWLAAGDWFRFHRYGKLDVWDAEVGRIAEVCAVKPSVANLILRNGLRDEALADPARAAGLANLADPAAALGVADLV